jgi:hypothetical protein
MKTLLSILIGCFCFSLACQAEVFVYKNKIKYNSIGGGGITKLSAVGWTVISDTGYVTQVLAFAAEKRYAIVPIESIQFAVTDAGGGKQYTYYIQSDVWTDGDGNTHIDTGMAKGLNTSISINGTVFAKPVSFDWTGRSAGPANSSGQPRIEESSGVFTLDKKWTATCNSEGDTIATAPQRLVESLTQQGYQSF